MIFTNRVTGGLAAFAAAALLAGWAMAAAAPAQRPASRAAAQPMTRAQVEKIVREYLLANPEILIQMTNALQRKQEAEGAQARGAALAQVGMRAMLDPKVAFVTGPANAKVTVVEFFDYRCGHCKASLPAIKSLAARGTVRLALIEYPILTADSLLAAQAAVAARRQSGPKYLAFHFALMSTNGELPRERILEIARSVGLDVARLQRDMQDPAVTASVKASQALASTTRWWSVN
jgi:protein-disulfide isomerase